MSKTTIVTSISWSNLASEKDIMVKGKHIRHIINKTVPDMDFVCDMGDPFQETSRKVPPERRIFVPTEPSPILGVDTERVKRIGQYYKGLILAWHGPLRTLPQTVVFTNVMCWIHDAWSPSEKIFGVSGFVSPKNAAGLRGYAVRRKILSQEHQITIPSMVWNFRKQWKGTAHKYPVGNKREGLRYMYHFSIENHQEDGWFTEKIMDCFRSYSVPIYYGDPKITNNFNAAGIIILDEKNIPQQVNSLTPDDYERRMPAIKDNYNRAGKYFQDPGRVISTIANNLHAKGLLK